MAPPAPAGPNQQTAGLGNPGVTTPGVSLPRPGAPALLRGGPASHIRASAMAEVREDDLLLMAVDLDGLTVTDALAAYGAQDDPLLPMGGLARLLDLNINVSPAEGQIIGTLGEAQRPLTIDLASGTFRLNGKGIDLKPEDVAVTAAEIYIRTSAVQRILPLEIKVDVEALSIKLHALETLPIQARAERLANLRNLQPDIAEAEETLRIPTPYKLLTAPAFDISGQIGASVIAPRFPHSYDLRIAGDVLYTGFQGYVGSDLNGDVASVRATFERHNAKGGLLGPLNATAASIGDVDTPALNIGPRGASGRGFTFSTAPLEQTSVFNRIDLRGELPVGYDVELYINDVLRSGQRTPTQGRYEFLNVPLVQGVNVIRIVTNGPRGERTEQTRIINVGGGQVPKGQLGVNFGVVQQGTPLISGKQDRIIDDVFNSGNLTQPGVGRWRITANATYGLSNTVTLVGGAALFPAVINSLTGYTTERELVTAGVRTSFLGASLQMDAAADSNRGAALAVGVAAQPFGVSTVARQVFYRGQFIDESTGLGDVDKPIASHTEINTDFSVRAMKSSLIPLSLRAALDVFTDRSTEATAGFRTSASVNNVLMSGGFDLQSTTGPGVTPLMNVVGNLAASTFYQFKWQLRANLDYNISPLLELNDLTITADRDIGNSQALRLGVGQGLTPGGSGTTLQIGDIVHTHLGDLSLTGNYTVQNNQWQLGASFAVGLVYDPYAKRYVLTRPGPAQSASVAFASFMDANGNGIDDPGEKPVPLVTVEGGIKKAITDAGGRVFIVGAGAGVNSRLTVGLDGIEDPFVQSPPKVITFAPRAGLVVKAPFPMNSASELIAHVALSQDGRKVGLSAVRVRLVTKGKPPVEGVTEFDGTVGFENLGPGSYQLELDPEQATRLHMRLTDAITVVVPQQGGAIPDVNAVVVFDRPPQQAAS